MEGGVRLTGTGRTPSGTPGGAPTRAVPGPWAWALVASMLAAGAVIMAASTGWADAHNVGAHPGAWQRDAVLTQPWTLWAAAWVHLDATHLAGNLAALVLLVWMGWLAHLPARAAVLWLLAWPLTHAALLLDPRLSAYVGASATLHAGYALAAVLWWRRAWLLSRLASRGASARSRPTLASPLWPGLLLAGLIVKLLMEAPWSQAVPWRGDWPVAVGAHLTGAGVGILLAWAWRSWPSLPLTPPAPPAARPPGGR